MIHQERQVVRTRRRGFVDVSEQVIEAVARSGVRTGWCQVFCLHTSASLIITENADPAVLRDLERVFSRLVPDGAREFEHDAEGPDDMAAHARSVLTRPDLTVPVAEGAPVLGTWQGVFLWEQRLAGHERTLMITVLGE